MIKNDSYQAIRFCVVWLHKNLDPFAGGNATGETTRPKIIALSQD